MSDALMIAYGGDGSGFQLWWLLAAFVGIPVAGALIYALAGWALGRRERRGR